MKRQRAVFSGRFSSVSSLNMVVTWAPVCHSSPDQRSHVQRWKIGRIVQFLRYTKIQYSILLKVYIVARSGLYFIFVTRSQTVSQISNPWSWLLNKHGVPQHCPLFANAINKQTWWKSDFIFLLCAAVLCADRSVGQSVSHLCFLHIRLDSEIYL